MAVTSLAQHLQYTEAFDTFDSGGSEQARTEDIISERLFYDFEESSLYGHAIVITACILRKFVYRRGWEKETLDTVHQYLTRWAESLEVRDCPDEEEANTAAGEILLIALYLLNPLYVQRKDE